MGGVGVTEPSYAAKSYGSTLDSSSVRSFYIESGLIIDFR
jgi:hypothetical protein